MANEFAFDCLSITQQHIDNLNEMSKTLPISHMSLIQELSAVLVPYTSGKFQLLSDLLKQKLNIDINAEKLQFIISLIRSDVLPSFSTGLSAKELIVEHSLLNKLPFFTPYQLIPFTDICPICNKKLDRNLAAEQLVKLYLHNHRIVPAVVYTLTCTHSRTDQNKCDNTLIAPNYIQHNNERIFTYKSFNNSTYLYFGGKYTFDRNIFIQFVADWICQSTTFQGFLKSYNLQHIQKYNDNFELEFILFTRTTLCFALINFMFFMGLPEVVFPKRCSEQQMDMFFELIEPYVHHLMANFWLQHKVIKSCGTHCSCALIGDGNYNIRRPICVFNQKIVQTPEFNSMNVGCRNSPQYRDIYCEEHKDMEEEVENNSCTTFYSSESFHEQYNQLRNGKKMYYDSLSCKTRKSKPGAYISKTFRTLGVVTWTLNCNIIVSSTELVRSESIKEIINGLCQLVRFSQTGVDENSAAICFVPRNIVYDDGCHLLKAIIDHYGTNIHRNPATTFLFNNCKFSIDRLHYANHRSAWCKENLNPDRNSDLTGINTGACEQTFSWFNKFAKSFSCMRSERCQLIIHLMFHYWNCRHVGLNPYHKDIGRRLLPDDSDAHQEQLYELEDVEDDSDSNSSTPILASQTVIPNQSPLYSDDSRTSTNSHLPSDNISKRLSTTQQALWEKLQNMTCIDEFEKQLQSEDEEDDNSIDRRSTRIFNGLLFH
ncbi:unnamed protein product [Adineta steineri]|uniref:CxC5 like cysteine cluster associated with KDZ domain-containing protein n=1 Tax=Adineta steineri TaxID=433720 RepID=A0A818Z2W0_9BILA|nr:unnamed protein product [Adineta steineri]CAF3762524.1 unnamed protein product [Adineta steineri]